jgi:hypothetical protein
MLKRVQHDENGDGCGSVGTIAVFGYAPGMNEQSPIVSEFATPEEAAAYEEWLRAKVAASLADERPSIPHDEVMAEMRAIIERKGRPADPC